MDVVCGEYRWLVFIIIIYESVLNFPPSSAGVGKTGLGLVLLGVLQAQHVYRHRQDSMHRL